MMESLQFKKRRMMESPVKSFMMLPDDLVLNCLARVSRYYYPNLYLVSKRFGSLLASTKLYQTRTLLCRTESCLYVCLRVPTESNLLRWFILCERPNSSRKSLVPISSHHSNYASLSGVAVVGPRLYAIGGGSENNPSSSVMVMECPSHTWRKAPSMRVARVFPSTCVLDGKIYVNGGCDNLDSTNWMEVFDTKTQTWEFLQIPSEEICIGSKYKSVRYEGTVYVRSEAKNVTYKLHNGRWRATDISLNRVWGRSSSSYCVIENVFYAYTSKQNISWYNPKNRVWKTIKGLEGLPNLPADSVSIKLADHGGKMAILWEEYSYFVDRQYMIWCAVIAIEKCLDGEILGKIECVDNVFTSHGPNEGIKVLVHALTSTLW